ncbi:MAG TPA: molybdopterin dinucleotide binding domain-containing protein, partial [Micromonosporaceae bacterium]
LFLTETARLADVVLPAATWGEKLGTFTNADRTVHLCAKAVDAPGEARADLDIFLDYARRMDFTDRDGAPLLTWHDSESTFEAWKACSAGRPCDYTGLSYAQLGVGSGIQWPCTATATGGTERLYHDAHFPTEPQYCQTYGRDLETGAEQTAEQYRASHPSGRAFLHAVSYLPSPETPSDDYPLLLNTGRTVSHFHTRTKTGRAPELNAAAPDVWVEMNPVDAGELGVGEGDVVVLRSLRGCITAPVRLSDIRPGTVFVPFHYGYWDTDPTRRDRAANELVATHWDAASKQPLFKLTAVNVSRAPAEARS